ncbi:MAG: ergothioneine biosynthesis protein EgtB [Polyangiaceae bacterium]
MPERISREAVLSRYRRVRRRTEALVEPLSVEDMSVQSMPDASPTKWHLAHTTWFFEEFVLARFASAHRWHDERWRALFNSYYEAVGPRHPRPERGLLSRPSIEQIWTWRIRVDEQIEALLSRADPEAIATTLLGTHHEQQHQELILTDIKHAFSRNELHPAYSSATAPSETPPSARAGLEWLSVAERVAGAGHSSDGFAFDNERPRHRLIVTPFAIADRLVTNAEYMHFIEDGAYGRPELWLADGWATVRTCGWIAPLYWEGHAGAWRRFTLWGLQDLEPNAPVSHVSLYEADAYARWANARLPTEYEWEVAAEQRADEIGEGNFIESGWLEPVVAAPDRSQFFGDAWEWTGSAYLPYPRFRPLAGPLGEYNGKFMSGQVVLRGGSCLSPRDHIRATYRNFFSPATRWQVSGIRLARDA